MIDLHCHLLPGVDDGAESLEASLDLARAAVANGIQRSVLTPHMHEGRYDNSKHSLQQVFLQFQKQLVDNEIPLQVALAAEVRVGIEVLLWLQAEQIPFLGEWQGKPVILLELPHGQIPPGTDKLVRRLMDQGIQPMIAHPERNKHIIRDFSTVYPFVEMGCLFQLTAGSPLGQFGPFVETCAQQFLERGWATILATDAHSMKWRPPNLAEGRIAVANVVGEKESWNLVRTNPMILSQVHFKQTAEETPGFAEA